MPLPNTSFYNALLATTPSQQCRDLDTCVSRLALKGPPHRMLLGRVGGRCQVQIHQHVLSTSKVLVGPGLFVCSVQHPYVYVHMALNATAHLASDFRGAVETARWQYSQCTVQAGCQKLSTSSRQNLHSNAGRLSGCWRPTTLAGGLIELVLHCCTNVQCLYQRGQSLTLNIWRQQGCRIQLQGPTAGLWAATLQAHGVGCVTSCMPQVGPVSHLRLRCRPSHYCEALLLKAWGFPPFRKAEAQGASSK